MVPSREGSFPGLIIKVNIGASFQLSKNGAHGHALQVIHAVIFHGLILEKKLIKTDHNNYDFMLYRVDAIHNKTHIHGSLGIKQ